MMEIVKHAVNFDPIKIYLFISRDVVFCGSKVKFAHLEQAIATEDIAVVD